jgi:hypothetical protein
LEASHEICCDRPNLADEHDPVLAATDFDLTIVDASKLEDGRLVPREPQVGASRVTHIAP